MNPQDKQVERTQHTSRKLIPGFKGYEAEETGMIWSVGSNWRGMGGRLLATELNADGYPSVRIIRGIQRIRKPVHVLVALAFLGPKPSERHEVRHIDGSKFNNHISNLAWGTRKENADDREAHGRTSRGESHSAAIKNGLASKAQPTPGPWHAGREHISDDIEIRHIDKRGRVLAIISMQAKCDDLESCANARLIASAPELLEACKETLNQMSGFDDSYCEICDRHAPKDRDGNIVNDVPHKDDCAVALLETAIAKAEGSLG